jgi:DHA1 family multidrug resistance protein-like MFS transporter
MSTTHTSGRRSRRPPLLSGLPPEVAILAIVAFCVALGFGIVAPALPVFAKSFQVSAFLAGTVISVFAFVRLASAVPAGWLVDRTGERIVLATGLIIVAVSSALAGLSTSFVQLVALRGVGGFGSAMFSVSSMALLLRVVAPELRGRAVGTYQGGFLLGAVAGPAVGGIVTGISIRLPFFIYAGTLSVAAIVVITMLARTELRQREAVADSVESGWTTFHQALRSRPYFTALFTNLAEGFSINGLRSYVVPLFVIFALHKPATLTGLGLVAATIVQAVLLLPAGRIADTRGRKPALMLGTGITVVGTIALALTTTPWLFLLAMAILGAGAAFLGSAPAAVVGDVAGGKRSGSLVAGFQMSSDVGSITGPLVAGAIIDATGSYEMAFLVGAAVVAVAFALSATMPETRKAAVPTEPTAQLTTPD